MSWGPSFKFSTAFPGQESVGPPQLGLQVWLGAERIAGANGDYVSTWYNGVSGGPNAVAAAPSSFYAPGLKLASGQPACVQFDGVQDRLVLTGSAATLAFIHTTGLYDIFLVTRRRNNGIDAVPFANTNTTADKGLYFAFTDTGVQWVICAGGSATVNHTVAYPATIGQVKKFQFRGDGSNSKISADLSTFDTKAFTAALGSGNASADYELGSDRFGASLGEGGSEFYDGDIHCLLIYNRNLSAAEVATVRNYISRTFGV